MKEGKCKLHVVSPIVVFLSLFAIPAVAQDDGLSSYDIQSSTPSEIVTLEDSQVFLDDRSPLSADSLDQHSSTPSTGKQVVKKEDDSALSFNFLYYIIENFKFSDMMDKSKQTD